MKSIVLSLIAVFTVGTLFAQSECNMYHKKNCDEGDGTYMKYDSQSKSALIGKGQTSEFHLVAYHGLDYRVVVCNEENLGDQLQFKVYEKKKMAVEEGEEASEEENASTDKAYRTVKELLYDNSTDSYSRMIEFTAENNMRLLIEVTVPGDEGASKLKIRETGCVGVLISHIKSNATGF